MRFRAIWSGLERFERLLQNANNRYQPQKLRLRVVAGKPVIPLGDLTLVSGNLREKIPIFPIIFGSQVGHCGRRTEEGKRKIEEEMSIQSFQPLFKPKGQD